MVDRGRALRWWIDQAVDEPLVPSAVGGGGGGEAGWRRFGWPREGSGNGRVGRFVVRQEVPTPMGGPGGRLMGPTR